MEQLVNPPSHYNLFLWQPPRYRHISPWQSRDHNEVGTIMNYLNNFVSRYNFWSKLDSNLHWCGMAVFEDSQATMLTTQPPHHGWLLFVVYNFFCYCICLSYNLFCTSLFGQIVWYDSDTNLGLVNSETYKYFFK